MGNLLFQNAIILTSREVIQGDLRTENGRIAEVGQRLTPGENTRVIDASGKFLLPGGIDPHTHFDLDVGFTRASDDFYTGTVAAAFGGNTAVVDHMAFGPKGCALTHQPKVYHELAKDAVLDYGLHGVIQHVDAEVLADMETLRDTEGISSFKAYLTYDFGLTDRDFFAVLRRAKELGLVVCVHCENDAIVNGLRARFVAEGKTAPRYHPLSRPAEAEAEAVQRTLALAKAAGETDIYVVHLTTAFGLEAARLARRFGQRNIYLETCPQYLFLDDSRYNDDKEGLKYVMSPPLRKPADIEALWAGLDAGDIQTVGTDHCPFFFATQKQRGADDFTQCPNGAPGVELRLPLLFSRFAQQPNPDWTNFVRLTSTNPAKIFGLSAQKGDIRPGLDADLALFDPALRWTVTKDKLHENVDYTPYEGMQLQGAPVMTVSRGDIIVENGRLLAQKGRGRYLKRGPVERG